MGTLNINSATRNYDDLFAGDFPRAEEKVTILDGQVLTRGSLLGKVGSSVPTTGTADGGNTGDGTMTGVAGKSQTKVGTYTVECVEAASDAGRFKVIDPDGDRLDDAEVGVAYSNNQLAFTLNDGATDFAVGDKFTVVVAAGGGKYLLSDDSAVDGSEDIEAVLGEDVDASEGDVENVLVYLTGEFNVRKITFGGSHSQSNTRDYLRSKSIFLKDSVSD